MDAARETSAVRTGLLLAPSANMAVALDRASSAGHPWLLPHWTSLTGNATKAIARAHDVGLTVVAWTVDDTELMRSLADAGIDGIVTNDLGGAASLLAG